MNKRNSVLIAGATGLVGQALVAYLLSLNYNVKVLTRNKQKAYALFGNSVGVFTWPDENEPALLSNSYDCDAVINLAGKNIGDSRWTNANKQRLIQSRVESVNKIYSLVNHMQSTPKTWIQASAIGYYGADISKLTSENGAKGDGFLASIVQQWESAFENSPLPKTRKVILRFGVVMSNSGGFLKQMKDSLKFGVAVCPGAGNNHLSYIHIDDLIRIIELALRNELINGVVNTVAPKSVLMKDFISQLKIYSKGMLKISVPSFLLRLVLGKEKANELVLANQNICPKKLVDIDFKYQYSELSNFL